MSVFRRQIPTFSLARAMFILSLSISRLAISSWISLLFERIKIGQPIAMQLFLTLAKSTVPNFETSLAPKTLRAFLDSIIISLQ